MEFPRLVFRSPGPDQCQGGTYAHASVADQEDFDAALAEGWYASVPEALNPPPIVVAAITPVPAPYPEPVAPPSAPAQEDPAPALTRDEMKRKADSLSLTYPHNISNIKLAELLDAALAKG